MTPVMPVTALRHGEMTTCVVDGIELLVCQVDGQYFAVDNRCSHAGQKLSSGRLDGYELVCPLHRARFDIRSGAALSAPAQQAINRYPVEVAAGKVHVDVSSLRGGPR